MSIFNFNDVLVVQEEMVIPKSVVWNFFNCAHILDSGAQR